MEMEILYWLAGLLWVIGAIAQIAKFNSIIHKHKVQQPYSGLFLAVWVVLFFSWPYWYFYDRNA